MYSTKQLKAIIPAKIVGCSPKHIQSVIEELVATSLALAKANKKKDRLLSDEAVTVLKLIRRRDELLKDAKRYWWLRNSAAAHKVPAKNGTEIDGFGLKVTFQSSGSDFRCQPLHFLSGETLDAAVDEAIALTKGGE